MNQFADGFCQPLLQCDTPFLYGDRGIGWKGGGDNADANGAARALTYLRLREKRKGRMVVILLIAAVPFLHFLEPRDEVLKEVEPSPRAPVLSSRRPGERTTHDLGA